eukprot:scaffold36316_cov114-Isochrysis_galbana.AAC.1
MPEKLAGWPDSSFSSAALAAACAAAVAGAAGGGVSACCAAPGTSAGGLGGSWADWWEGPVLNRGHPGGPQPPPGIGGGRRGVRGDAGREGAGVGERVDLGVGNAQLAPAELARGRLEDGARFEQEDCVGFDALAVAHATDDLEGRGGRGREGGSVWCGGNGVERGPRGREVQRGALVPYVASWPLRGCLFPLQAHGVLPPRSHCCSSALPSARPCVEGRYHTHARTRARAHTHTDTDTHSLTPAARTRAQSAANPPPTPRRGPS